MALPTAVTTVMSQIRCQRHLNEVQLKLDPFSPDGRADRAPRGGNVERWSSFAERVMELYPPYNEDVKPTACCCRSRCGTSERTLTQRWTHCGATQMMTYRSGRSGRASVGGDRVSAIARRC